MKFYNPFKGFTVFEWCLWIGSLAGISAAQFICGSQDYLSYATSLIGVTSLIFAARGDPLAPVLFIVFSLMYATVSYFSRYFGEMLIYLCMQLPVSALSLVTWLKNRNKNTNRVKTGKPTLKICIGIAVLCAGVTTAFYFLLKYLGTANLIPATVSVATSFTALSLMVFRVPQYALAFILNDVVMIVLWSLALAQDINYISLVVCFSIFLLNDAYTFFCWTLRAKNNA